MPVTSNSMVLPQAIRRAAAVATAAKTTYADGTNAVLLASGGANGSLLRKLSAIAQAAPGAAVSATQLQLFLYDGTNYRFVTSATLAAYTASSSAATVPVDFGFTDALTLYLPSGWSLYVGIGVALAAGIAFNAELGDF